MMDSLDRADTATMNEELEYWREWEANELEDLRRQCEFANLVWHTVHGKPHNTSKYQRTHRGDK